MIWTLFIGLIVGVIAKMLMPGPLSLKQELIPIAVKLAHAYAFSRRRIPPVEGWTPSEADIEQWDAEEKEARTKLIHGDQLFLVKVKWQSVKSKRSLLMAIIIYLVLSYGGYAGMLYQAISSRGKDGYMVGYSAVIGPMLLLISYCCCCKLNLNEDVRLGHQIQAIHKELNDAKSSISDDKDLLAVLEQNGTVNHRP